MSKTNWTDERTAQLTANLDKGTEVTQAEVQERAEDLEVSTRSISSKLRKMGYEVEKVSTVNKRTWSDDEEAALNAYLEKNSGEYTYAELAAVLFDGKFTAKSLQGKVLSMEMTDHVKPTEKTEAARTYTPDEEATFLEMADKGASIEQIAEKLGKSLQSVRGKSLSFIRTVEGFTMPPQEKSYAQDVKDPWADIKIGELTVAEIAEEVGKSERGVKTTLTRRGLTCKDYDGAAKAAKAAEKRAASGE